MYVVNDSLQSPKSKFHMDIALSLINSLVLSSIGLVIYISIFSSNFVFVVQEMCVLVT